MERIEVTTKKDLKKAVDAGCEEIYITGKLAERVVTAYKIRKYSKPAIAALATALAATTVTGPLGLAVAAPIVAVTGMEIALIVAVASLGIALILSIIGIYLLDLDVKKDENGKIRIRLVKKNEATA